MLKPPERPECEAFQRSYERGSTDPHLERCGRCRRFARFVDSLAEVGHRAPLEDALRARLRGVSAMAGHRLHSLPRLPQLPLPPELDRQLKAIARRPQRSEPETLPIWIRSPRYAVAASYLLTLLIAGTLGNPAAWASENASRFERVGVVIHSVEASGREGVGTLNERFAEGYAVGSEWIRASRSALRARWHELAERFQQRETGEEPASVDDDEPSSRTKENDS